MGCRLSTLFIPTRKLVKWQGTYADVLHMTLDAAKNAVYNLALPVIRERVSTNVTVRELEIHLCDHATRTALQNLFTRFLRGLLGGLLVSLHEANKAANVGMNMKGPVFVLPLSVNLSEKYLDKVVKFVALLYELV